MLGAGFLAILTLALLMWAGMSLHARITRQPPPWRNRAPSQTPPMIQAYWGAGVQLPEISPEQRRKNIRFVAATVAALVVVAATAAWIIWALTHDGAEAVVAAIFAYVGLFLVALPIAVVVDARRAHRER